MVDYWCKMGATSILFCGQLAISGFEVLSCQTLFSAEHFIPGFTLLKASSRINQCEDSMREMLF